MVKQGKQVLGDSVFVISLNYINYQLQYLVAPFLISSL